MKHPFTPLPITGNPFIEFIHKWVLPINPQWRTLMWRDTSRWHLVLLAIWIKQLKTTVIRRYHSMIICRKLECLIPLTPCHQPGTQFKNFLKKFHNLISKIQHNLIRRIMFLKMLIECHSPLKEKDTRNTLERLAESLMKTSKRGWRWWKSRERKVKKWFISIKIKI